MTRVRAAGSPPAGTRDARGHLSVPWLGTTWVDRGRDYRRRRLLALAVMAAAALVVCGLSGGLVYGAWSAAGSVARAVIIAYVAVGVAWGAGFGWRLAGQVVPAAPRFPVVVLPLVFPFSCGAVVAVVVAWSLPVVPVERAAREGDGRPGGHHQAGAGRSSAAPR